VVDDKVVPPVECKACYGRACCGRGQGRATCGVQGTVRQGLTWQRAGPCHLWCARHGTARPAVAEDKVVPPVVCRHGTARPAVADDKVVPPVECKAHYGKA
jgi:hypothetical protein